MNSNSKWLIYITKAAKVLLNCPANMLPKSTLHKWIKTPYSQKGRKRHIVVDVLGCMLSVDFHAANIHDAKSGIYTAKEAYMSYPTIQKFCADAGYRGTFVSDLKEKLGLGVDIS